MLRRALSADMPVNEDFSPIFYYYHLRYWMSQFQMRFGLFEAGLLAALAIYVLRLRPIPLVVFCGGFAGVGVGSGALGGLPDSLWIAVLPSGHGS